MTSASPLLVDEIDETDEAEEEDEVLVFESLVVDLSVVFFVVASAESEEESEPEVAEASDDEEVVVALVEAFFEVFLVDLAPEELAAARIDLQVDAVLPDTKLAEPEKSQAVDFESWSS